MLNLVSEGDLNGLERSLQAPNLLARSAAVSRAPKYGRSEEELVGQPAVRPPRL